MDIKKTIEQTAQVFSDKTALIFKGQEVSFDQLQKRVKSLANGLASLGIGKGDKVAIYLPNCCEYVYSYLAVFALGAVGVPLDVMLKEDELFSCLEHSEAKALLAVEKDGIQLEQLKGKLSNLKTIVVLGRPGSNHGVAFESLFAAGCEAWPGVTYSDQDPALIVYTSGTTGSPKGILLTYKHLDGSPKAMEYFVDLSDQDVKLAAIPFSHIGGFIYIQNCIQFGITLIVMDRFNPVEFLNLVQTYHVTCFHIVPPMYTAILTLKQINKYDLSSLRWVVVFGAPSSPEMMKRFHQYCPNARLLNGWGMTETCPPNTVTPLDSDNIASVGKPSSLCDIKVVNEHGEAQPAGEIGEIIIKGEYIMAGYYKDQAATDDAIKDGWLHTGDLGRFDQEGFLYIVGRKKEMIKVGGQIVYAPEVEAAFYKHEAVAEAAVIGVADKIRGEAVKAFIVLKEGQKVTPEDLRYFAKEHLAKFKVPQVIELCASLPRNRTGKIDKAALQQTCVQIEQ